MQKAESLFFARNIGIEMFHRQGLTISRPKGSGDFVFIHFLTPVRITIEKQVIRESTDACIVYSPADAQYYANVPGASFGNNWMHFTGKSGVSFLNSLDVPLNRPFRPLATAFIASELRRINDEKVGKKPYWEAAVDMSVRRFFIELARSLRPGSGSRPGERQAEMREEMLKLRASLMETCYESWNIDKMAAEVHLSRSRFSVLYRQLFRISPVTDLLHMRIDLAKYYLGMMQMANIGDVAESCGFSNVYYFHRQFKKIVGMTPRAFQASYSGGDLHPPHHPSGAGWS